MTGYSNQTNLAIKGIIGLKAMSQIAQLTKQEDKFGEVADRYLKGWKELGINSKASPPHTTLSYGDDNSHGEYSPLSWASIGKPPN